MHRSISIVAVITLVTLQLAFTILANESKEYEAVKLSSLDRSGRLRRSSADDARHVKRRYLDSLGGGEVPLFKRSKSYGSLSGVGSEPNAWNEGMDQERMNALEEAKEQWRAANRPAGKRFLDSLGGGEVPLFKRRVR